MGKEALLIIVAAAGLLLNSCGSTKYIFNGQRVSKVQYDDLVYADTTDYAAYNEYVHPQC